MARKKATVRGSETDIEVDEIGGDGAGGGNFLEDQADEDRANTKAKHVDDGLDAVKEMVGRMKKGIDYAMSVHDLDVKLTVLNEVADTAAAVTDDARRAVRNAKAEKRNAQPSS